jgi:hypothetical protein
VFRNLRPGRHVLRVWAIDATGARSPIEVIHFRAGRGAD